MRELIDINDVFESARLSSVSRPPDISYAPVYYTSSDSSCLFRLDTPLIWTNTPLIWTNTPLIWTNTRNSVGRDLVKYVLRPR